MLSITAITCPTNYLYNYVNCGVSSTCTNSFDSSNNIIYYNCVYKCTNSITNAGAINILSGSNIYYSLYSYVGCSSTTLCTNTITSVSEFVINCY